MEEQVSPAVEESQTETPEAAEAESPVDATASAEMPRKFRVSVNGEEQEVDEQTLIRDYQLAQSSHKRFQEAADARKQAEATLAQVRQLAEQARQDPRVLFNALGLDAKQFAEALLMQDLEESLLSPQEKELRDLRNWRAQQEQTAKQQREQESKRQQEALLQQAGEEIENEIVEALQAGGLKPTPRTVARVAEELLASLDGQGNRKKASDAIARLRGEYRGDVVEYLEAADPEVIEREHPGLYQKLLQHASKKVQAPVPTIKQGVAARPQQSARRAKTIEEWLSED